ncbi:MAG: MASE1 domain-containing protein, partial [Candidatus Binatia bacterium]
MILGGQRLWPAIGLGAFLVNFTTNGATIPSLAIACGNTLEALLGAWLVQRFAGGIMAFHGGRGVACFVFAAALSALPAATIGAGALVLTSLASAPQFGAIWLTWWLGDLTGTLIAAPLLILWLGQPLRRWTLAQTLEAFALAAALGVVGYLLFAGPWSDRPFGFVVLPVLVWSGLRFGPRGAATTTTALSAMAIAATVHGAGPFASSGPHASLLLLQAFTVVVGLTSLLLAAVVEERERTKETLRGSEARFQAVAEAAPVFLFTNRPDGACDYVSPQFYDYTGASPGAALGEGWLAFIHPGDRETTLATFLEARCAGRPHELDQRLIGKNGLARWFRVHNVPQRDAAGAIEKWIGVCVDIHERREIEAERDRLLTASERARKEAETASRAKDEFLAMLGHELRNPLGAVHNALLASRLDPSSRERGLEIAWRQVEQLTRLVDDLLDIARVSEGKIPIRSERVRLAAVIEQALDATRPIFEAHGHRAPTVVLPPEAVDVVGDSARLQQVVANILGNAAKFTPSGRSIEIALERRGSAAIVRVRDAGIGIPRDLLGRVFDPFVQGETGLDRAQG